MYAAKREPSPVHGERWPNEVRLDEGWIVTMCDSPFFLPVLQPMRLYSLGVIPYFFLKESLK